MSSPKKYGKDVHYQLPLDESATVSKEIIQRIQVLVGSILLYSSSLDSTFLVGLNTIAIQQTSATENTLKRTEEVLYYAATHPDKKIRHKASDMILQIHRDASYLSEPKARSRAAGHYFLGCMPQKKQPIRLNGSVYTLCTVLKFIASSAAEEELGALLKNIKEGRVLRLTLAEIRHPHPPTPIHCDNATVVGMANENVKKHRYRPMENEIFLQL